MQVIVDKHTVTINKNEIVNEGEYNVQACNFQFSSEYDGLPKIAIFKTDTVTKQILLSDDSCITPSEVLESTGIVGLGVYAYENDGDNLILRYSPTPAVFTVEPGSYDEGDAPTPPTPSEIEQLQAQITENANNISSLQDVTSTHTTQIETLQTDVNNIKAEQITQNQNIQTNTSDIANIKSEQTTQNENISQNTDDIETINNSLTNYSLITETGSQIALNVNSSNYQMTAILKDKNGNMIYTSNVIDLPIESMIINVTYDSTTKEIVFTLQNGTTLRVSVADLVSGLVSTDELNTILANYYTKSEINTLLSSKANSSDVYTKNETDNLLNGKVDVDAYTQGQTAQDANIEENATNINWLQTLVNQMPTVSGQGTDLSLQDVLNYRLMKFLPQGSSSQESTSGTNLIGLTSRQYKVSLQQGDKITVRYEGEENITLNLYTNYGDTTRNDYWTIYKNTTRTITVGYNSNAIAWNIAPDGLAWINLGSALLSYEPYTGGIPAPNPDYPYPVKSVTGENSLFITTENILPSSSGWERGDISSSQGGININSTTYIRTKGYFPAKENETYYFSYDDTTYNYRYGLYFYKNDFTFIEKQGQFENEGSYTMPAGTSYVRIACVRKGTGTSATMPVADIDDYKFQWVKGSTAPSEYVPHEEQIKTLSLGNIELNSSPDGTVRDGIIGTLNNWFKREYIGKVVLNGSEESWAPNNNNTLYGIAISNIYSTTSTSAVAKCLSNYFIAGTVVQSQTYEYILSVYNGKLFFNPRGMTLEQFKTWLSTHNTIVYYVLATPVDIPITDTTLINQLNDIYNNAHSYNGVTNITTTYEDGNEQMYLDIEALKNVWSTTSTVSTLSAPRTTLQLNNQVNIADVDINDVVEEVKKDEE